MINQASILVRYGLHGRDGHFPIAALPVSRTGAIKASSPPAKRSIWRYVATKVYSR